MMNTPRNVHAPHSLLDRPPASLSEVSGPIAARLIEGADGVPPLVPILKGWLDVGGVLCKDWLGVGSMFGMADLVLSIRAVILQTARDGQTAIALRRLDGLLASAIGETDHAFQVLIWGQPKTMIAAKALDFYEQQAKERQLDAGKHGADGGRNKKKPLGASEPKGLGTGRATEKAGEALGVSSGSEVIEAPVRTHFCFLGGGRGCGDE